MYKGKAIYQPKGKAAEYAQWACSFYVGCSNGCTYCYLKKGRGAAILGGDTPTLKACFRDENHAIEVFEKELKANLSELQKHGLFFSFTTDPMLAETNEMTYKAVWKASIRGVPCSLLTKNIDWIGNGIWNRLRGDKVAFGFTLTGHDELEPSASTNAERVKAMKKLHNAGFKTFASIEPIVDFNDSFLMILKTVENCDLFKIGLMSGSKHSKGILKPFIYKCIDYISEYNSKIYFKDSLLKQAGINRESLPENCVDSNYNMFNS